MKSILSVTLAMTASAIQVQDYLKPHVLGQGCALAQEGDICEGHNESTGKPFPKCDEGLVCEDAGMVTIEGAGNICQKPLEVERVTGQAECEEGTLFDQHACACFEPRKCRKGCNYPTPMHNPLEFCECISLSDYYYILFEHDLGNDCQGGATTRRD